MEKITPDATINDVNRKPLAYALMILGALVSVFVGAYVLMSNRSSTSCEARVDYLQIELHRKDSIVYAQAFQIKANEETKKQLPAVADSLLHKN